MKMQAGSLAIRSIALLGLIAPALIQPVLAMEAPEEIIVTGQQSLHALELKIELTQDRMFGLFNDLNDDDNYDIRCTREAETGTRISQRVCRPEFLRKAIELNARAFLAGAQGSSSGEQASGTGAIHSLAPQAEINFRYPILKEKMATLVERNPEFAEAVAEHQELIEEMQRRTSSAGRE